MMVPRISVICPTFNSSAFIEKTLATVFFQSLPVYEIIVSDDGSTDGTLDIVENIFKEQGSQFKCKLLKNSHLGPGAARNAGIRSAQGDWIAFLDSDDLWFPEKIKEVMIVINKHSDINFICHNENRVSQKKGIRSVIEYHARYQVDISLFKQLYYSNIFSTSAVVCRKSLLLENGLFDVSLMSAQDYELWLRLSQHIKLHFLSHILGEYLERNGNITSGSMLMRIRNEIKIAYKYKNKVSTIEILIRLFRIFGSFTKQFISRMFK